MSESDLYAVTIESLIYVRAKDARSAKRTAIYVRDEHEHPHWDARAEPVGPGHKIASNWGDSIPYTDDAYQYGDDTVDEIVADITEKHEKVEAVRRSQLCLSLGGKL